MRIKVIVLGVLVVGLLVAWVAGIGVVRMPSREVKLSDGSVIRVEDITYGPRQPFKFGGLLQRVKEKLAPHLPKSWTKGWIKKPALNLGNWWMNATAHTNSNALQVWITRHDALTGAYQNVGVQYADLVDSHGCVLTETLAGGENAGLIAQPTAFGGFHGPASGATWLWFEAFPRQESRFKLRLYDQQRHFIAELTIANPMPATAPAPWQTSPLPIKKTDGDVTFILKDVTAKVNFTARPSNSATTYRNPTDMLSSFEVLEHGQPSKDWQAVALELWDSNGNFASKMQPDGLFLCPQEKAWKLVARFCGTEKTPLASNDVSIIRGVKIPAPGEFVDLTYASAVHSMASVKSYNFYLKAVGGPGEVVYSNDLPVSATRPAASSLGRTLAKAILGKAAAPPDNYASYSGTGKMTYRGSKPHIAVTLPALTESDWLTIRAVDDKGRECYADEANMGQRLSLGVESSPRMSFLWQQFGGTQARYLALDLPDDAATVDLYFCLHTPRTAEFIFEPPAALRSKSSKP